MSKAELYKKSAMKLGKIAKGALTTVDKKGKRMQNGYTGRRVRELPILAGLGVGATALYGGSLGSVSYKDGQLVDPNLASRTDLANIMGTRVGNVVDQGELPMMLADGGSNIKAPNLGANGNIVLGMHNTRKGGV